MIQSTSQSPIQSPITTKITQAADDVASIIQILLRINERLQVLGDQFVGYEPPSPSEEQVQPPSHSLFERIAELRVAVNVTDDLINRFSV